MDHLAITDRRRLRRKLTFWRFAGLFALVLLVAGLSYAGGWFTPGTGSRAADHVARVEISGIITPDADLLKRLERIRDSNAVRGVIVTIESPGGTTYGGERIYNAVREIAEVKPVVAEVRGLAASAGYMIASAADHIVAGEASIVGSIGVLFQYGNVGELLDRLGISVDAIKSSPLKAEPSPFGPPSPEAEEMIRSLVMDSYDWFVELVAERRDFTREQALALADGSIFTGRQALQNGLVDTLGAEAEARAYLETRDVPAGLDVIDWEEERRGFFLNRALAGLGGALIREHLPILETLQGVTDRKLFLDGLVSVWHLGGADARDDRGNRP